MRNMTKMMIFIFVLTLVLSVSVYAQMFKKQDGHWYKIGPDGALVDCGTDSEAMSGDDAQLAHIVSSILDFDGNGAPDVDAIDAMSGGCTPSKAAATLIKLYDNGLISSEAANSEMTEHGIDSTIGSSDMEDVKSGDADFLLADGVEVDDAADTITANDHDGGKWFGTKLDARRAIFAKMDAKIDKGRFDKFRDAIGQIREGPDSKMYMPVSLQLSNQYPSYGEVIYGYISGDIYNITYPCKRTQYCNQAPCPCAEYDIYKPRNNYITKATQNNTIAFVFIDNELPLSSGIYWDEENKRWVVPIDTRYVYNAPRISSVETEPENNVIMTKDSQSHLTWEEVKYVASNNVSGCTYTEAVKDYPNYRKCIILHQYQNKATIRVQAWDPLADIASVKVLDNESQPVCNLTCQPYTSQYCLNSKTECLDWGWGPCRHGTEASSAEIL